MSFIDKAKQQITNKEVKGGNPMGNPFKKPTATKSNMPEKKAPSLHSMPKAPRKLPGGLPKPNGKLPSNLPKPGTKPQVGLPKKTIKPNMDENKEITPVEPVEPIKEEIKTNVEANIAKEATEIKEVKEVAEIKEVTEAAEIKENTVIEEKHVETKEKEEEEEPKTNKRKRTSKKSTSKKSTSTKEEMTSKEEDDFVIETLPTTDKSLSFDECVSKVRLNFVDPAWEEYKKSVRDDYTNIVIPSDANRMQLDDLLSQLSALKDRIQFAFNDIKTNYEILTAKDDGLMDQVKRMNSKGTNAEERKVNATKAVASYNGINLYELLEEMKCRYNFMKLIMDSIEFKKGVLLTMLSARKGEK